MTTHTAHKHDEHDHGAGIYVRTLLALLFLTVITVGASYIDFGAGNVVIALFIATIKATLVALFFMHLKDDKPVNAIIAIAGFLFLGIFLMFDFIDFGTRNNPLPVNFNGMPVIQGPSGASGPAAAPEASTPEHK
jgi:cytochrome c oxidase subunit 4